MNDTNNDDEQRIKEKLEFFMTEKVYVHVELKDKSFLNGLVLKKIKENVYWVQERKLGQIFLFLKDIYNIDQYQDRGKE